MVSLETDKGRIHIKTQVGFEEISELTYSWCFEQTKGYQPFYRDLSAFRRLAEQGAYLSVAVTDDNAIVGFAVLDQSDEKKYWGREGRNKVLELKAIEVLREYRKKSIAGSLLKALFQQQAFDDRIICLAGYVWTWDLAGSGLAAMDYRMMLMRFYSGFGFEPYQTSEPNINLKPENFFMARFGKDVQSEQIEAFKWARFGLSKEYV